ncbi:hypothetical protein VUR80DRAFT_935 [Thermomyces stellatus]
MSSESEPISPRRFAAALPSLPLSSLRLKVLEIRNSISHLLYSNAELRPFADADPPDEVCAEAIRENEIVLERMLERISLLKEEVENRGARWEEFDGISGADSGEKNGERREGPPREASDGDEGSHPAWSDGTFQTGTIRLEPNGDAQAGGSLSDAELARQLEERMRALDEEDTTQNGVHL